MTLAQLNLLAAALMLTACAGRAGTPVETVTVERTVEVARPCPAVAPTRPAPLGAVPAALAPLAALLAAKLKEYAAPGGYADRAEAALRICRDAAR